MAVQKQDDQHEHTFSNYVRIQDVVHKNCLRRWTIGKSGDRGSGTSVLPARHHDVDDDDDDEHFSVEIVLQLDKHHVSNTNNFQTRIFYQSVGSLVVMALRF